MTESIVLPSLFLYMTCMSSSSNDASGLLRVGNEDPNVAKRILLMFRTTSVSSAAALTGVDDSAEGISSIS